MNGSNGACTCDELIAARKRMPSACFHDCDFVRARGEYEDFVTDVVMPDGNVLGQTSRNHRRERWQPPLRRRPATAPSGG